MNSSTNQGVVNNDDVSFLTDESEEVDSVFRFGHPSPQEQ
jgi:hypothetical protein